MAFAATILVFSLFAIGSYFIFFTTPSYVKDKNDKKEEIIEEYRVKLNNLLEQYKDDNDKQIEEKKIFLKECNDELSRNIFFTEDEAKKIIQDLSKI